MAMSRRPLESRAPRNMPSVLKSIDDAAGVIHRDQPAVTAERGQHLVQHLAHRLLQRQSAVLDRGAHVMGGDRADEVLAVAGGGHRAHAVLGVGAGADDR